MTRGVRKALVEVAYRLDLSESECIAELARAFNFGPDHDGVRTVEQVARAISEAWPRARYRIERPNDAPHEAATLMLDCTLARQLLGWQPIWDGERAFEQTAHWYRALSEQGEVLSRAQLTAYVAEARACGASWAGGRA